MGFLGRLKDATIGFSGYARLGRSRWAFGFMSVILVISVAVGVARWTLDAQAYGQIAAREMATGPDWGLVDGEFHYEGAMPAFPAEGVVVDTTGTYKPEQLQGAPQGVLITKDRIYNWNSPRMQVIELSEVPFNFTRADMSKLMQQLYVFVPLLGVMVFLFQLGFKALDAVILAWIGQMAVKENGRPVPFGQAYQIALYAMTIPIILQWVFGLSSFGRGFVVWWAVAIIYTIGGLRAYVKGSDDMVE
jgi:hypothetical protein